MSKSSLLNAVAASALSLVSFSAFAVEPGHGNLYYIPSANLDVEVPGLGDFDDDGDGFGGNLFLPFGVTKNIVLTGEYQTSSYDEFDFDYDQYRVGLGWQGAAQTLSFGVFGEYIGAQLDDEDADGFGIQGRLSAPVSDKARLYGQIGYLMLEDDFEELEGFEYLFGGSFDLTPRFGLFADLRTTALEGSDSEIEYEFQDFRIGGRFVFDGFAG